MEIREKLRRAAGLFVELPPEERPPRQSAGHEAAPALPPRTVEQLVRDTDGPNLDEIRVSTAAAPQVAPDGKTDFGTIYQHAGLPAAPFSAEQMLDLLTSLPTELPLETRRQTVKVTLGAMGKSIGATSDTIVADASRKMAALAAYTDSLKAQTTDLVAGAERDIATLQAQIEEKRRAVTSAQQALTQATQSCSAESDKLDDVLEFFSLDIPPSRHSAGQ